MLHQVIPWLRFPARLYLHWCRRTLRLDSDEVPAVRIPPGTRRRPNLEEVVDDE